TGFMFDDLTPGAIYDVAGWAVWAWYNKKKHINAMRKRAMQKRFSWEESAGRYAEIYKWALERRLGIYPRTWK
ncbi:MAG: glycogen synthase, partial [Spirochaetales bacterium]